MVRMIDVPIEVKEDGAGRPREFSHRGRRWRVLRIVEDWLETGEWWKEELEALPERRVYRLFTEEGLLCEIYSTGDRWFLYRTYD